MSTESDGGKNHDADDCHETDDSGRPEPPEYEDCDPDLIDDLACQAEGIQAHADYNTQPQTDLKTASDAYTKARSDYRAARSAAVLEVQDLRHQAKQLVERIRCQITQERVIECLDDAFKHI